MFGDRGGRPPRGERCPGARGARGPGAGSQAAPGARGASSRPGCRNPSWAVPGSTPAAGRPAARLSNRLVWLPPELERRRRVPGSNRPAPRPGTGPGPRARRPCWPGRPWSGCPRADTYPDRGPASGRAGRAAASSAPARRRCSASMPIGSPSTSSPAISAPENEPSQRWCASGSGSAAPRRNCLSLKSKLKLRWSTGSRPTAAPARACAGEAAGGRRRPHARRRTSDSRPAARRRRPPQDDLDLVPREPAQEVSRQDRRVAERLVEPAGHLGQELVDRLDREGPLVMVGPQVPGDGPGVAALVEARVFESRSRTCGRSPPARLRRARRPRSRNRRRPREKHRCGTSDRRCRATASRNSPQNRSAACSKSSAVGRRRPADPSIGQTRHEPASQHQDMSPGKLAERPPDRIRRGHVFVEEVADQAAHGRARGRSSGWARTALGSEPKASPPPGSSP